VKRRRSRRAAGVCWSRGHRGPPAVLVAPVSRTAWRTENPTPLLPASRECIDALFWGKHESSAVRSAKGVVWFVARLTPLPVYCMDALRLPRGPAGPPVRTKLSTLIRVPAVYLKMAFWLLLAFLPFRRISKLSVITGCAQVCTVRLPPPPPLARSFVSAS